ncbi:MAG: phosphoenolpyruvate synthase [Patescibacteria group bacterium]|nr:phosphoenolpyruvate synthase [Patescibacteria group bacterium]
MKLKQKHILWFSEIRKEDTPLVGGKNSSLGEMYSTLTQKGIKVPNGFAITAAAFRYYIEKNNLKDKIKQNLKGLKKNDMKDLARRARNIREAIEGGKMPADLELKILAAYHRLGKNPDVAVRTSATAEDLPEASFAGMGETYLNVSGRENLLDSVKKCFASMYTDRSIFYREENHFNHFKVYLSVGVQKMVRSDLASSGIIFSLDTESGFKDVVLINATYGLGENIVQGRVNPDEFYVFKPTLAKNKNAILSKTLGDKAIKMIYDGGSVKNVPVPTKDQDKFSLTNNEVIQLAKWAVMIEKHYGKPMDMEWAKDGRTGQLFMVQARPETVHSRKNYDVLEEYLITENRAELKNKIVGSGKSIGSKIGAGEAHVITDVKDIGKFRPGQILVTEMTDPDWVPVMKIAGAIVTNSGGRTCHAAIVSRELGVPCIVGTGNATEVLKNGEKYTVNCAEGEAGIIYEGLVGYRIKKTNLKKLARPKTKIMLNVGEPERAFEFSFIPNDGVGLAREEFIINNYIKIHPMALINFDKLTDKKVKAQIEKLTKEYADKTDFYVGELAEGIARIAAAFYPKDVIVRLSDFKTDEYRNLIGGKDFEPLESDPMIGWRGSSRYYDPGFQPAFELECKALKKVRDEMGLDNVKIMVPFCRTPEEGRKVLKIMESMGLVRGKNNLQVYVMCEIPSNIILADEFSKIFDGFSIGSNDLTMLVLGLDRNSGKIANVANEKDAAVKKMISEIIKKAKENKRKIGICGQAPSDFPDFAQFLVREGIDSISLNPDSVIKTMIKIKAVEKRVKK